MDSTVLFMGTVKKAWKTVKRKCHKVTINEYVYEVLLLNTEIRVLIIAHLLSIWLAFGSAA